MKTINDVLNFIADSGKQRDESVERATTGLQGADKIIAGNYVATGWNYALVAIADFIAGGDGDER